MAETQLCPCGSEKTLARCCLPIIEGKSRAQTAEELLRARYTAFARGEIEFILATHHSKTRDQVDRKEVEDWSRKSEWLGLKILQSEAGGAGDQQGTIAFHAQYRADGKTVDHQELSLFERENGEWRFLDARGLKNEPIRRTEPKIGRNDPCHCGSGKKLKKCCGQ